MSRPYLAAEDSALLREALEGYYGGSFLEIGAGNGGGLVSVRERFGTRTGTDVVRPGISDWSDSGADFVLCDKAACFRDGVFDVVAFNPPYLRSEVNDRAVDGGERLEIPAELMREALRVTKAGGKIVFLLGEDGGEDEISEVCEQWGAQMRKVAEKRIFYGALTVYEADRR